MDERSQFPSVRWPGHQVSFTPSASATDVAGAGAVVVFAWSRAGAGWLLADIEGRGWTVPSGRIEEGESALEAAVREVWEEAGAHLLAPRPIGCYALLADTGQLLHVPAFLGEVRAFGAIPPGSESRGVRAAAPTDVPALYYMWDPLLAAVFAYAHRCLAQMP